MSASGPREWERLSQEYQLTPKKLSDIDKKLDKMDASGTQGPWTRRTLQLISEQPGIVSTVLAMQMKIDRYEFKALVYKLKQLGLTHSLEVGYAISPRGRTYLRSRSNPST